MSLLFQFCLATILSIACSDHVLCFPPPWITGLALPFRFSSAVRLRDLGASNESMNEEGVEYIPPPRPQFADRLIETGRSYFYFLFQSLILWLTRHACSCFGTHAHARGPRTEPAPINFFQTVLAVIERCAFSFVVAVDPFRLFGDEVSETSVGSCPCLLALEQDKHKTCETFELCSHLNDFLVVSVVSLLDLTKQWSHCPQKLSTLFSPPKGFNYFFRPFDVCVVCGWDAVGWIRRTGNGEMFTHDHSHHPSSIFLSLSTRQCVFPRC
jgi:hypothetical protein